MLKIAICDDNIEVTYNIERMLKNIEPNLDIETYYSAKTLISALRVGDVYDIIFLDIEFDDDLNGVEAGKIIRNELKDNVTQIVYISGKAKYALDLFESRPMDFIVKPVGVSSLRKVLEVAFEIIDKNIKFFTIKTGNSTVKILYCEIKYFECQGHKIKVVTVKGDYLYYGVFSKIDIDFERNNFIKIHKSYIVNTLYVKEYHNDYLIVIDDDVLPISRASRPIVKAFLLNSSSNK
ncbi:MAG: LytTR family DNA-binding domain-containing protein [Clostridia bacterium]|nr:LytTR family DNA-binding domain-containing protein [Clostridia bacterium]